MSDWKDFFYFYKGDRIAIVLLSILICLGIIVSFYLFQIKEPGQQYIAGAEKMQNQFVEFEEEMNDIAVDMDTTEARNLGNSTPKKSGKAKLPQGKIIDLNSASADKLIQLPGIGQTLANRIVEYRSSLGGFVNLEQLQEVKGLTGNRYSNILPYLTLKQKHRQIKINEESREKLLAHPYIKENHLQVILTLRESGKITGIEDLKATGQFTAKDVVRLEPYLLFE